MSFSVRTLLPSLPPCRRRRADHPAERAIECRIGSYIQRVQRSRPRQGYCLAAGAGPNASASPRDTGSATCRPVRQSVLRAPHAKLRLPLQALRLSMACLAAHEAELVPDLPGDRADPPAIRRRGLASQTAAASAAVRGRAIRPIAPARRDCQGPAPLFRSSNSYRRPPPRLLRRMRDRLQVSSGAVQRLKCKGLSTRADAKNCR